MAGSAALKPVSISPLISLSSSISPVSVFAYLSSRLSLSLSFVSVSVSVCIVFYLPIFGSVLLPVFVSIAVCSSVCSSFVSQQEDDQQGVLEGLDL